MVILKISVLAQMSGLQSKFIINGLKYMCDLEIYFYLIYLINNEYSQFSLHIGS